MIRRVVIVVRRGQPGEERQAQPSTTTRSAAPPSVAIRCQLRAGDEGRWSPHRGATSSSAGRVSTRPCRRSRATTRSTGAAGCAPASGSRLLIGPLIPQVRDVARGDSLRLAIPVAHHEPAVVVEPLGDADELGAARAARRARRRRACRRAAATRPAMPLATASAAVLDERGRRARGACGGSRRAPASASGCRPLTSRSDVEVRVGRSCSSSVRLSPAPITTRPSRPRAPTGCRRPCSPRRARRSAT